MTRDAAARVKRFKRRTKQQRERVVLPVLDATPQPCPFLGGGVCDLDARKHYHLSSINRPIEVVEYGSERDLQHQASMEAYYAERGRMGYV